MNNRSMSGLRRWAVACLAAWSATLALPVQGMPDTPVKTDETLADWTKCAIEGGVCRFTGTHQVRFGRAGHFFYRNATDSIACNSAQFGDPLPGTSKVCQVSPGAPPPEEPWVQCAAEHGVCSFAGERRVRYGLDGRYAYQRLTGPVACNNEQFGDPYPGANKLCKIKSTTTSDGPYGQNPDDYVLSFHDEFDGDKLDAAVWNEAIWYDTPNPTKNFAVENGSLKIWPQRDANGQFFNRTIDTDGKFYQTYGYFEIDAKLPVGKGTWPGFWIFNHIGDRRPEMDIMEAYAGGAPPWGFEVDGIPHPQAYAPTVWLGDYEGHLIGTRQFDTHMDLSADFHKYGVKWEPNRQTYYFDGQPVMTLDVAMGDPMYVLLDLWFGSASGQPDDTTPTGRGNSFEIRYVRAWDFKAQSAPHGEASR
ncbi:MAG TPA: glycoside hydrolase family 16 protein [Ideonella sp.]|uniref:glycoside hydrolase family 16 protein n=1 Tax=Ideonella sp. TaxID=1929293 RepID=UPI002E302A13|nr:glycoside hydrolase family 16 protein [Ideonella sp.]HEX5683210.1 glycoside hydrolase family 16 protein [Ideonella sp.]